MKLPALAIAACVAAGILVGGTFAPHLPHTSGLSLVLALLFLLAGFVFLARRRVALAWAAALLAWGMLGAAAAWLEPLALPADHVTRLAAEQRLALGEPLRWRGRLRDDPLRLPWGLRYIVDLDHVESGGRWMAAAGGLRITYYFGDPADPPPIPLRAGNRVEALVRAQQIRNYDDPGAFDYHAFFARQNIFLSASLRRSELLRRIPGPPPTLAHRLARLRGRLLGEVDAMLAGSPNQAAVARAMLLGDRSFLDNEQVKSFQQTGAYHVLVLAGLHVGVLAAVLLWAGRKLRLPLGARTLLTLAALSAYVAIVDDRPPILRAALMATAYLLGRLLFRRPQLLNAVSLAALAILLARPSELTDASFLLSFLAAGTIAGIALPLLERTAEPYRRGLAHLSDVTRDAAHAPRVIQFRLDLRAASAWLAERLPGRLSRFLAAAVTGSCRMGLWLWDLIFISLAIQLGMLPLMAQYFHRISVVAPAANVPAVLLTAIIVPFGFASLGATLLWAALGHALGRVLAVLIALLVKSVDWFALPSWASFRVPTPPVALLVAFFLAAALLSAAILWNRRRTAWSICGILLVLSVLLAAYPFPPRLHRGDLEATVLDVGQGDSIFVAFPDGHTMLVDGGGIPGSLYIHGARPGIDIGETVVSPFLWARGLKRLDVVALTHPDQDHLDGLLAVLRNFRVGQLWVGRDVSVAAFRALIAEARARHVPVVHHRRGDDLDWAGVQVRVLWPPDDTPATASNNNDCLVLHIQDRRQAVLLTGDIESPVEHALVRDGDPLSAQFLKVAHHGSRTSSTAPFLAAVHPRFAAISVGAANSYGHPNAEVLARLAAEGARVFRTDRDGAVTALTDGRTLDVRAFFDPR
jgi:competence protein ComEC